MSRDLSALAAAQPQDAITRFLHDRIVAGDFPAASYLIAQAGTIIFADAIGLARRVPQVRKVDLNTIFDLASLTKPLVTGLLCALLIERGVFSLDQPVSTYIPAFADSVKRSITLRHLLSHSSGLPAWRPLYLLTNGVREKVINVIAAEALEYAPGTDIKYSDLGFILLGHILELVANKPLDQLAVAEIFKPLSLMRTGFSPAAELFGNIAASEVGNAHERDICRDIPESKIFKWREQVICGAAHDGNAYFMGGVAGHAGLFSNLAETFVLARQFIGAQSQLLQAQTCMLFRKHLAANATDIRSFAWQLAQSRDSTAGPEMPRDAFGHLGFTGTMCWVDAAHDRIYILLTNRTHDHELPLININPARREFNRLAATALDKRQGLI